MGVTGERLNSPLWAGLLTRPRNVTTGLRDDLETFGLPSGRVRRPVHNRSEPPRLPDHHSHGARGTVMGLHFIPQRYLKGFECPGKPDYIWMYDKAKKTTRCLP